LLPYLRALSSFRDNIRQVAIGKGESALKDILALCDKLRDTDLVPLGVALDDQDGKLKLFLFARVSFGLNFYPVDGKALVKLVPPAELIKAREEKRALVEAKAAKKQAAVEAEKQKRLQKILKGKTAPDQFFRPPNVPEGTYGSYNDDGIPLTDGEGKELSKNQVKKVQKDYQTQKKLHEEYLTWVKENPDHSS